MRLINYAEVALVSGGTSDWAEMDGQQDCVNNFGDFGGISGGINSMQMNPVAVAAIAAVASIATAIITSFFKDSQPPKPTKTVTTVEQYKCEETAYGQVCSLTSKTVHTVENK